MGSEAFVSGQERDELMGEMLRIVLVDVFVQRRGRTTARTRQERHRGHRPGPTEPRATQNSPSKQPSRA